MITAATIAQTLHLDRTGHCFTGKCPSCGYRGFTVEEREGKVLVHCHAGQCDQSQVLATLKDQGLWAVPEPHTPPPWTCGTAKSEARTDRDPSAAALRLWSWSRPPEGSAVATYLRCRGYLGPIPLTLRLLPKGRHAESKQTFPVMLAGVARVDLNRIVAVHRTFLAADGSGKAGVTPDKKSLGPIAGGAVWLAPAADTLCVAEGIETALSCQQATGIASAAALSAGGMEHLILPPLPLAAQVIIAADNTARNRG